MQPVVSHTYTNPGTYTVYLKALHYKYPPDVGDIDNTPTMDTTTQIITVHVILIPVKNMPPSFPIKPVPP